MAIGVSISFMWGGSVASIPATWKRTTALDGLFPKATADATDPNVAGGNATHQHTSPPHGHSMASHGHDVVWNDVASYSSNSSDSSGSEGPPGHHYHAATVAGVTGGALSSVASTYGAVSNMPPYHDLIFIEPNGAPADFEDGIIALWNQAAVPTGFAFCDGTLTTPDLRNKYIHGAAAATGAGATGGSYTNVHVLTHTHVESAHGHSGATGNGQVAGGYNRGQSGSSRLGSHNHSITLDNNTAGGISSVTLTTTETVEPAYKKIMAIKNIAGAANQPQALIGLWLGTLATIPAGWSLCDGTNGTPDLRDKWIKIVNTAGEIGNTGGSNTHIHAAQTHGHTGSPHNHTGGGTGTHWSLNNTAPVGGSRDLQDGGAAHTVVSVANATPTWSGSSTTADSANNEPPFLTVAYIMWTGTPINEERGIELRGAQTDNEERGFEITGVNPAEEKAFHIQGKEADYNERGFEISGKLVWTPESKPTAPTWTPEEKLTT